MSAQAAVLGLHGCDTKFTVSSQQSSAEEESREADRREYQEKAASIISGKGRSLMAGAKA